MSVAFATPVGELSDEASPDTIEGWDSLSHVNAVLALEAEFGITLSDDDVNEMFTVGSVCEVVERHTSAGARS